MAEIDPEIGEENIFTTEEPLDTSLMLTYTEGMVWFWDAEGFISENNFRALKIDGDGVVYGLSESNRWVDIEKPVGKLQALK